MASDRDTVDDATAIRTDGLTRRFGDVVAVDGISLAVRRGEVFGFLGPNGAGKSTTIDLLVGFSKPTAGTATVLGHDATAESVAIRRRTGLLPEGFRGLENLSAREHVVSAIRTKDADDDPDAVIERVGLDPDDARRPVGEYSTGMYQRMALAVALVGDPDLLILDEPSRGLDPKGAMRLRRIVRAEVERGATVFFSSHVLDEVAKVCDRVGILHRGELVAVNTVGNLRAELGAGSVVEVTVDGVPEGLPVRDVDGVTGVSVDDRTIRVTCARPEVKMPVLRRLDDHATVADVRIEEPSLEDVFEAYTPESDERPGDRTAVGERGPADPATADLDGD